MNNPNWQQIIKDVLSKLCMSEQQLAKKLGVSQSQVHFYKTGKYKDMMYMKGVKLLNICKENNIEITEKSSPDGGDTGL